MPVFGPLDDIYKTASHVARGNEGSLSDSDRTVFDDFNESFEEADVFRKSADFRGMRVDDILRRNAMRYAGDHWSNPQGALGGTVIEGRTSAEDESSTGPVGRSGIDLFTLNRAQGACLSQVALAFSRPASIRFVPVESSSPTVYFIKPDVADVLLGSVASGNVDMDRTGLAGLTAEQLAGAAPIPAKVATTITAAGLLHDTDFFRINDDSVSRDAQRVFDVLFRLDNTKRTLQLNELYCSIFGFQPALFEWNADRDTFHLENVHVLSTWLDRAASLDESEYAFVEFVVSLHQAIASWPKHEAVLRQATTLFNPNVTHAVDSSRSEARKREMVRVRMGWQRWRSVPMTWREALRSGDVIVTAKDGTPMENVISLEFKGALTLAQTRTSGVVDVTVTAKDGSATRPDASNWPTTFGVREACVLPGVANGLLYQRRCPYFDIPLVVNQNVPMPYTMYAQGDPERGEDLNQAANRLVSILLRHARYYQAPMEFWPEDLYNTLKGRGFKPYVKAGRIIPVPMHIYESMTRLMGTNGWGVVNAIPPIPSFYVRLLELVLNEYDREMGHLDVVRGQMPSSDASGTAIQSLQSAAQGPIAVKSSGTEDSIRRFAFLALDAMRKWLPLDRWQAILDFYPPVVLHYIRNLIDVYEFDIDVEVFSGRGINKMLDLEKATRLYMGGSPSRLISRTRAMELADIANPEAEERAINEENREQWTGIDLMLRKAQEQQNAAVDGKTSPMTA